MRSSAVLFSISIKEKDNQFRRGGTGGVGGAVAPPIFLKIGGKIAFSTPNISRLVPNGPQMVISIPNILHHPPGLVGIGFY